ncbi:acyltransferase family protein [Collimonas sp. OK412]|jgi:peptidoglycan/LPS O-acetylase OafA/YrhL|uniref:acyltransferase family protein n=1 Tax=Collimonas sp. (strain OK412) TaxID=1801619 RepID=UPI0008F2169F|nr:acyltransferase family protein [Collimonas sp. OK412]SFB92967.1 Peptidoglycan/LPS O-acetylase OafA/YrhL, contains acyltransferase and SGNH-hydrolase domains [Collimonas sp. OK412]
MPHPSPAYIPAIDGLRAIAVLSVIIFHANFLGILPGGFTGVDMFFVISGYVISQSLSERFERADLGFADYLKDFYRRRFLRILPALLVVLFASFLASAMFMPQFWLSELMNRTGLAAFFGFSNFVLAWNTDTYFSPSAELNPYLHTWSLAVEEQFYVIFPAIYFVWLRYRKQTTMVWAILPVLALASLAISAFQTRAEPLSAFYLLPSRFWELAAGAMLFQVIGARRFSARPRWLAHVLLPAGLALVMAGFLFAGRNQFPFPWALATVSGSLLMIAALVLRAEGPFSPLQRLLQSPLATYIGRLSYSLYLWHWPVAVFLRWTTGLEHLAVQLLYPVIVVALAAASYHWIETPIRSGKSLLQRRAWVAFASSFMALGLFSWTALWISDNPDRLSLSQTRDTYTWYAYRHFPREEISKIDDPQVEGRQLFVIGDSHTAAYRTMLKIVSLKLGIKVLEYEQGGCGVVTLIGPDPAKCAQRRETDLKAIEAQAKPGDIVFLASLRMPELDGREWQRGENAVVNEALAELTPSMNEGARSSAAAILAGLEAAQVQVLIDAPKPLFKAPPNRCSDWFNKMNPVCAPGLTMERVQLERLRAPQMQLLDLLQREHPGLTVWDPLPLLCPGATCSAYDDRGKPLYFDSNHLSGHGNRVLTSSFTESLLSIWRNLAFKKNP